MEPSKKLLREIEKLGGVSRASRQFRIADWSLRRWLEGKGEISLKTAGIIAQNLGCRIEDLVNLDSAPWIKGTNKIS